MITLNNICKQFPKSNHKLFDHLNFSLGSSQTVAIKGRSGSGKSTLLKIMAGMDTQYTGIYEFNKNVVTKNPRTLLSFRKNNISIITQNYHLLQDRSVGANLQLSISKKSKKEIEKMLFLVGLENYASKRVSLLSGGEAQRVAIARALLTKPKVLLADEPTGALDEQTELEILNLFQSIKQLGTKIIIVTHSDLVSNICDTKYTLTPKKLLLTTN
ncbi:ATP-binding cassette domain-containing protein [Enterococcus termitis]|uniref:ABC transporter domain-containing protein n=1 Tax=Enterococcus termitis TaxID=332950 RepID=A0A1E5GD35_9ENTE|nr:ATP-binding cassette domain-containing protein [Enterococcus termitis]OEG10614.1 hypothetical protein BCR25_09110 [Enterococcus termitis]OJG97873.1 lipoprotein releasing system, ATP-binding protein [Enterococcus termitis]